MSVSSIPRERTGSSGGRALELAGERPQALKQAVALAVGPRLPQRPPYRETVALGKVVEQLRSLSETPLELRRRARP